MACWDVTSLLSVPIRRILKRSNGAADPDFLTVEELGVETPSERQPQPWTQSQYVCSGRGRGTTLRAARPWVHLLWAGLWKGRGLPPRRLLTQQAPSLQAQNTMDRTVTMYAQGLWAQNTPACERLWLRGGGAPLRGACEEQHLHVCGAARFSWLTNAGSAVPAFPRPSSCTPSSGLWES